MSTTTRKRSLMVVAVIAGVVALLFHYKERDFYRCVACSSVKAVTQWRLGLWGPESVPLTPHWERVTESRIVYDFLPVNHTHDWKFAQGSPYYFFGLAWGGCGVGIYKYGSQFCVAYEGSSDFRSFIQAKLRDGSLSKSRVTELVGDSESGRSHRLENEANELIKSFSER
jgi:hypothetical protein